MNEALANATALIEATRKALERGVRHFDIHGKPLLTVMAVLVALNRDGQVTLEDPK